MPNNIEPIPFLVGADFVERRNVAWRIEMGQPDARNPLIEPLMPWDDGETFMHGTVLRDPIDGLWKAWSTAAPIGTFDRRLVYYQSNDGVDWQRPEPYRGALAEPVPPLLRSRRTDTDISHEWHRDGLVGHQGEDAWVACVRDARRPDA